jgi:Raf kinase inhibitor-like YbhB/YbcL family protein
MRRLIKLFLLVLFLTMGVPAMAQGMMTLSSNDVTDGGTLDMAQVYNGCGGGNVSPHLTWSGAPEGTKSFAVTVYDPDAPTGSGWWHWQAFNISPDVSELSTGASMTDAMPAGAVENTNDYDEQGFGGACPPEGDPPHRYIFTVFALDVEALPLTEKDSAAKVGFHLNAHKLDSASITATYGR